MSRPVIQSNWQGLFYHGASIGILALAAVAIATQPLDTVVIASVVAAMLILAGMTPVAALMALLVLAPLRTLIATEAPLQLPLDIGQIALLGFLTAWAIYRIARGQSLIRFIWSPLYPPLLIFIAILSLSAFNAASLNAWLTEWLKWVQILLLMTIGLNFTGERWQWLVFGLTLAGIANALVGIYEFFGGSGADHLLINDRFFRAFGTFGQPNPFGGFMGLLLPLALMGALGYGIRLWMTWRTWRELSRLNLISASFYAGAALLMLAGIFMSWSRGAWLGLGGALAVMAFALPRKSWQRITLFGGLVGTFAVLWFSGALPASIVERITTSTQEFFAFQDVRGIDITPENYAVAERLAHWQAALNMAVANPWLGVGIGNYEVVYPAYRLINWPEPLGHAHNYYLNILAETGIIGLLGYGKAWIIIIWVTWRATQHPDGLARFIVIGLLGSWVYLSIHSLFDNLYVNNVFLHLGLMLGIVAGLYNQTQMSIRLQKS